MQSCVQALMLVRCVVHVYYFKIKGLQNASNKKLTCIQPRQNKHLATHLVPKCGVSRCSKCDLKLDIHHDGTQ